MIRRAYKNLKIQSKFTIVIMTAVLMPFVILSSAFANKLYDMIISETIKSAQDSSAATSPEIQNIIEEVTEISNSLTEQHYYEKIFFTSTGRDLDQIATSYDAQNFRVAIENLEDENDINIRIYMGIPESAHFFDATESQGVFYPVSEAKGTYWYGIFQGSKTSRLYCPASYLSNYEKKYLGDTAYITYMTAYYNGDICPCYMAIYYPSNTYEQILQDNITFESEVSYIINEREEIVATTNEALSATYRLKYSDIEESLLSSNSFISRDVLGETVYVAFYYIPATKWFIVTVIPEEPLIEQGNNIIFRFTLIVIVCMVLALFFAIILSRSITGRISKVVHQMSAVKNGPPIPMPPADSSDEVGELIDTYNYMAEEMQDLILQEQRTSESLRIAEFNALQAQINPHFLYNTMDMINWMAKEGKTQEVSEVVQRLSRFYKLTLSRKNAINSIADELEHTKIYVELMNMRHGNAIDLVIDMPDELSNFSIPKLTLQPIVENSILHGILEKPEKTGSLIITGWEDGDDIILLISDDGVGIPEDKIKDILKPIPSCNTKGSNVAISNIHNRLVILCGKGYGLSYSSEINVGTEVTIRIPQLIG